MPSMSWYRGSLLILYLIVLATTVHFSSQQDQCQEVLPILTTTDSTVPPVAYNGIEPNIIDCVVGGTILQCTGRGVLRDGDIGPTHSVDVSDPDQVRRFFVWHRDNGTVTLLFQMAGLASFSVSYIDIYTLSVPSYRIGLPASPTFTAMGASFLGTQRCSSSSSPNAVSRTTLSLSVTDILELIVTFQFPSQDIDWLFISEIRLCGGTPSSSPISCDTPTPSEPTTEPTPSEPTDATTEPTPSEPTDATIEPSSQIPSQPTPPPSPPPITFSPLPPTVTPDLRQPDSVSLTCSVASPPTDGYQYQWQWWRSGALVNSDARFTVSNTNTLSSTLQITGLEYSDAGKYMCTVKYALCPDGVDCSAATPVTGSIQLNLPVVVEVESEPSLTVKTGESTDVELVCKVHGYLRDSSGPVWTLGSDPVQDGDRISITVNNASLLSGSSVSSTNRVESRLTISNVTEEDSGEYTCSVQGNSSSVTLGDSGSSSSSDNGGLIAGVMIAALLFLIILAATLFIIGWMIWRYRKNNKLDSFYTCSCFSACAQLKEVKMPVMRRHRSHQNGSSDGRQYTAQDIEVQIYSTVQKPSKTRSPPPPLPPQTLTEIELDELMKQDDVKDSSVSPQHQKPSRRDTMLSTFSQSGTTPKLVKITKLKKFVMKVNPIYQSADELEFNAAGDNADAVYALPSKPDKSHNSRNYTEESTFDPIYSEAIDPSMFKRASTLTADDGLHPYGPIYAHPHTLVKRTREPLEIGEENIREIKRLGVGQFGAVILAELVGMTSSDLKSLPTGVVGEQGMTQIAVKRLKPDVCDEVRTNFDKEIKFMSQLNHENIVQLLAVCTQSDNPFIAMEYMENGDLNQFLQKYMMLEDDIALYSNQIPPSVLLYMATQMASGMCYLASLNYVHRDLATRNCLVGANFLVKISDFGMSRNLYERVYYRVRGRAMLPIRWMATESFYGRFSEKSDVWAYGVAVWEIFTLGKKQPYEELDDQEMIQDAIRGIGRTIMNKPPGCPQAVYEVMLRCWEYAAEDRATFKEIHNSLLSIQQNT